MAHTNKAKWLGIISISLVLALVSLAYALTLPPIVTITASPEPANMTSTITAVATDLSHTGISVVEIFENGNKVRTCFSSVCSYTAVHSSAGVRFYQAFAADRTGRTSSSSAISVNFAGNGAATNHAPVLAPIGNRLIMYGNLLSFTISATDIDGDSLVYSASGVPAGASFNAATRTFSWTPVYADLGAHYVTFSVSDGSLSDSETIRIDVVNYSDSEAPRWYNLSETPANGSAYSPNQSYEFNITWIDDIAVSDVWIDFEGIVSHLSVSSTNDYSFAVSGLGAGTYTYAWYARDSSGNVNTTGFIDYVVAKALPSLSINMFPSDWVDSNVTTNVTGNGCPFVLACALYRNGAEVNNSDIANLADGFYTYVYNTTGNENYSARSVSRTLRVGDSGGGDGGGTGTNESTIRTITDDELKRGIYLYMHLNDKLKFSFCGAPYYIKLTDFDEDDEKAYFRLTPNNYNFVLDEGDSEELDLDYNSVKDILFKVDNVGSERVKIYIKRISDLCGAPVAPVNETESRLIEKLDAPKGNALLYVSIFLMAGIFLAALAILIHLLGKMRRQKR